MDTVGELGESGVLASILARLSPAGAALLGPGDDCAVMRFGGDAVVTSDTMIEGPDFRLPWHSGFELGWKLAATNLSDVASMGARASGLTVSLACPDATSIALLEDIAAGLDAACRELAPGCGVVGGDLGHAPVLFAAVTALGDLEGRAAVTRSGARAGDAIAYAGDLGLAGTGLALLFRECSDERGVAHSRGLAELREAHPVAIGAQLAPRPPIHHGILASAAGATAMMDVSDGLTLDAARIAGASGGAGGDIVLDFDSRALLDAFGEQRGERVTLEAMLFGGEDHGLLATFPERAPLPEGFARIGTVRETGPLRAPGESRVSVDGEPCEPQGWDSYNRTF